MSTFAGPPTFPAYFVDGDGTPVASVAITVYLRGTVTLASLYTSRTKATPLANPFNADPAGNAFPYADPGEYDALINGVTIPFSVGPDRSEPATAAAITSGTITGITDLAVADGGTGASSAGAARTSLGAAAAADLVTEISDRITDVGLEETRALAAEALKIDKATLDAQSVLAAVADNTPVALAVPASRFVGRKATGDVAAMTAAEAQALLDPGLAATYVEKAGATMTGPLVLAADGTLALHPTTKQQVDVAVAGATIADATALVKGKLQLAGDLGGTAAAPTVPGLAAKASQVDLDAVAAANGINEIVNHGTNAAFVRPAGSAAKMWVGTVEPANMIDDDLWLDTDAQAELVQAPSLVIPPASLWAAGGNAVWFAQYGTQFQRFDLAVSGTFRYILCQIGVSSGNIQVGVVSLSGSSLFTYERVAHSGIIASPGTGPRRIDIGTFALPSGPYALFMWADNTTLTAPHFVAAGGAAIRGTTSPILTVAGVPANGTLSDWASTRQLASLAMEGNV